ncbi:SGNH/GDSL hydrolase family protein [Maribacter chungangensis]|uniref:SGNH/GDSL hydrolase family protein n=1 Tax=Maribacter chungangensis TaxID=1069117 RepID=A0ABW3B2E4_9FLAO
MKFLFYILLLSGILAFGQDAAPFSDEVNAISKKYDSIWDANSESIVFTGSSSIRMWHSLKALFPEHQIINTGFGGSQAADLLYYLEPLVLRYAPKQVFIYEGDNDLSAKKRPKEIIATTHEIIREIHKNKADTKIVLMAAKPSISRWSLRSKYKRLNRKFKKMGAKNPLLTYADVWSPMLNGRKLKTDLFLEDGLHMNDKGYALWHEAIKYLVTNL